MRFHEIASMGNKIRRAHWERGVYVQFDPYSLHEDRAYISTMLKELIPYHPSLEDIKAVNWELHRDIV